VLAYNIPGVTNLVLTREQIVGIYNGSINNWSDPTFTEHNPNADLPNATILPIVRSESSGATEIFTRALSSFSNAWAAQYGVFSTRTGWNRTVVAMFAQRTSEMADVIRRQPYHIGYMITASAVEVNIPFASIINQRGRITVGNTRSVQAAMDERLHNMTSRLTSNLIDCKGEETYPIAAYSYFIVRMKQSGNCSVAVELARYVEWFLTSVQAAADVQNHLMVPVSPVVADRIHSVVLQRMTCDGQLTYDIVRQQKYAEEESLKKWKLPVQIVTPFIAVIVLFLIVYSVRQRVQYIRALDRNDWQISFFEIEFVPPRKRRRTANNAADAYKDATSSSGNCLQGRWNMQEVVTKPLSIARVFDVNRNVKRVLMLMREQDGHENVARFFGISAHNSGLFLVEQYCVNGSLCDFFRDNRCSVNQSFCYIICADIANGMAYLHRQNLIHGNLSIDKCYVDARWTVKVVDWEYSALFDAVRRANRSQAQATSTKNILHFLCDGGSTSSSRPFRHLAPEIQRDGRLSEPTRVGDIYSFGVIVQDCFADCSRQEPHQIDRMPVKARQIMELACHENSIKRPTFEQLEKSLRSAISNEPTNLLDRCVRRIII